MLGGSERYALDFIYDCPGVCVFVPRGLFEAVSSPLMMGKAREPTGQQPRRGQEKDGCTELDELGPVTYCAIVLFVKCYCSKRAH